MSTGQTFPDVLVMPDGRLKLISMWAKGWVRSNTTNNFEWNKDVPDFIGHSSGDLEYLANEMDMGGLIVRRKQSQNSPFQVSQHQTKQPQEFNDTMSNVIRFFDRVPWQVADDARNRAYGRFRKYHHELQTANKRKNQTDNAKGKTNE